MKTGRSQPNRGIAGHDASAIDNLGSIHYSNSEPCQVILALRIEGWHLGGFPTAQGAAGLTTALGDPLEHGRSLGDGKFSRREIIQEEQRLRPADHNVVHAHGHQIDPDGIVTIREEGDLQFRPDSISAGDKDWFGIAMGLQSKQSAEPAKVRQDFRTERGPHQWGNPVDELVACIDIDSGITIVCHRRAHLIGALADRSTKRTITFSCNLSLVPYHWWSPTALFILLSRLMRRTGSRGFLRRQVSSAALTGTSQ